MKKILLACSAGMSTSLLESKMNNYIKEKSLKLTVEAMDSASAKEAVQNFDVILLGPQVRFMAAAFKEISNGKPVAIIPMQLYGMMKGDEVVEIALELLKK